MAAAQAHPNSLFQGLDMKGNKILYSLALCSLVVTSNNNIVVFFPTSLSQEESADIALRVA